jgi:carboxypeptidase Q
MTLRHCLITVVLLLATVFSLAQPAPDVQQAADRLIGSILIGPSMNTLRELTDGYGGRLTGSPAYQHAADWAAAKFRSYGIDNVRMEAFPIPSGWQRGPAHGGILLPMRRRPLHVESMGWSPSTPGAIKADVVLVGDLSADSIRAQADKIKNHIVLFDTEKIFADGYIKAVPGIHASYPLFRDAGALAVLFPDRMRDNVLNAHDTDWGAKLSPLPVAQIGMEDGKLLARLLEKDKVRIELELDNTVTGPEDVNNVIAEIRGTDPDEWILIGAHLDSWDFGTGAQDNGTGTASVIEVARVLASLGQKPRRSIRFALWGGEEQGLVGSYAYAQAHTAEMAKCVAVLNTDNGSGHPKGWKVEARKDLRASMEPLSSALLKPLGADGLSLEATYDTDHGPFMLQGVPALDLWVDMEHYKEVHHKSSDTFDKVDPLDFKAGTAVVAVTAWAIAQAPQPIATHLDHAGVAEVVKQTGVEDLLKSIGVWKP